MTTLSRENKPNPTRTLFHSNPVLTRMSKITERSDTHAASYAGISAKTCYFLLVTLAGMLVQLLVKASLSAEPVWQTVKVFNKFTVTLSQKETVILGIVLGAGLIAELVGIFAHKTIPVTGTLYSASQGYFISFLVFNVLKGYEYLGLEALLLTVAVVAVMSWLYTSGKIQANRKFHMILLSLLLGSVCFGVLTFIMSLIPATRSYVQAMMQNSVLMIALDVVGLVIAALFLISDFTVIDNCVKEGYPKEYEWSAAFGLVFTVIWIYLKILDILIRLTGKDNK